VTGFDPVDLSSTPAGAPLVPLPPIRLRRTEILTVLVLGLHQTIDLTLAPGHIVHRYPGRQP
jgi:hypothetical protein